MSKKSKKSTALSTGNQAQAFSFGEPIPVLDRAEVLNYFESVLMYEKYYNPPINLSYLAKALNASAHHNSAITVKKNILLSTCKTTALLPQDVQATLAEFTVQSIVLALNNIQTTLPCRLLVCGGGAKNQVIMNGLKQALLNWRIQLTTELELDIDYVEAAAFAWLAYRRMHNLPANLPSVTGATSAVSLGAIFPKE